MKLMTILFAVLFASSSAFALDHHGDEKEKKKDREKVLNVSGMMCGNCENAVSTKLKELKGLKDIRASHEENKVKFVIADEHATDDEIVKAIKEAGFEVIKDEDKKERKKKRDREY